ncbi:MAG: ankyrin repeat domain-containing protein [Planctomycetaceae bacterium]
MDRDALMDKQPSASPIKADSLALSNAIESGDLTAVEALIQQYPMLVNHPDWTPPPLHCAVLWNQPRVAELLLNHGADIELKDPDRQTTPLRYAIMYGKTELIPLLLSQGANTQACVDGGSTAIQLALEAASGAFEEFEDLPRRDEYQPVVEVLRELGVK